ncbi:hypothetical protein ACKLNR_011634 [Fusarium oxysporum f. sp. zingiberi]
MADVVSSVTSLLSIVIQGFNTIQVARSFQHGKDLYQLQLSIIQLRLSRWGEAVGINPEFLNTVGETPVKSSAFSINTDAEAVEEILHDINQVLERAKKESVKWKPTDMDDTGDDHDDDLKPRFKRLNSKIQQIISKRCRHFSMSVNGAKWALYKKEQSEALTSKLTELIEQLEKVVKPESALDDLSNKESEVIGESLKTFLEAVGDCDPRLQAAASKALEDQEGLAKISVSATNNYGIQMGINRGEMKGLSFGTDNTITNQWHN